MIARKRRHKRIRAKISGTSERPRLSVFRSSKNIYAQLIDDEKGKTIVSTRNRKKENKEKGKILPAREVGKLIAQEALKNGVEKVIFDRGGYAYHGRVKALAEGAREGGLKF